MVIIIFCGFGFLCLKFIGGVEFGRMRLFINFYFFFWFEYLRVLRREERV